MNTERLRDMRATYQQKADAEQAAGNDKMHTFYRGCHSAICVVLGEMWNEKAAAITQAEDDELVDLSALDPDKATDSELLGNYREEANRG